MLRYENECVGCTPDLPCIGASCPNLNVPHYYCDDCGDEIDGEVYEDDGCEHCCVHCLCKHHKILD